MALPYDISKNHRKPLTGIRFGISCHFLANCFGRVVPDSIYLPSTYAGVSANLEPPLQPKGTYPISQTRLCRPASGKIKDPLTSFVPTKPVQQNSPGVGLARLFSIGDLWAARQSPHGGLEFGLPPCNVAVRLRGSTDHTNTRILQVRGVWNPPDMQFTIYHK